MSKEFDFITAKNDFKIPTFKAPKVKTQKFGSFNSPQKDSRRTLTPGDKKWLWQQTRTHICPLCDRPIRDFFDAHFDHKTAHAKGGKTTIRNTLIVHRHCNQYKSDKSVSETRRRMNREIGNKPKRNNRPNTHH